MAHQLPPDLDARVQAQLVSGDYPDSDAVLRDALDALERRQQSLARLREMVEVADEDIAAGRVGYFDVDATMQAVARRSATRPAER